ncbi:Fic/DOC family protein [Tabrizicola sp.]|uniref:Fic/DOC family protein n=1 Tax=Tabrizicola sp. TaxID=2005166 RepID=UPI0035AF4BBF
MPAPKPFDPFGDFDQAGYLQNVLGLSDPEEVKTVEHTTFLANLPDAIEALRTSKNITYQSFLDTHRILFGDFYPWAGHDRAEVAADLQISKGPKVVFANAPDIRRAIDYGLRLAEAPGLRQVPGAVMGYFAHAHPFLDGNGRTLMLVFGELCFRHGFSIAWERTSKSDYLTALTEELAAPEKGILDCYLAPFLAGPIRHDLYTKSLEELPGLDGLDRFLDDDLKAVDYRSDKDAASIYADAMKDRYAAYKAIAEQSK